MQKITCFLVDDDYIDNLTLQALLEEHAEFDITIFSSPETALNAAQETAPDVLFLDIDMPGITGLQLRRQLMHIPVCIFITALPDFALDSFELMAFDYIVKPYAAHRLLKTVTRVKEYFGLVHKAALLNHTLGADAVFIKDGTNHIKLQLHEIIYLEAYSNYTGVITSVKKHMVLSPISVLLKAKPFDKFIRVHRSFAVQQHYIRTIHADEVLLAPDIVLPVGRTYKASLSHLINNV